MAAAVAAFLGTAATWAGIETGGPAGPHLYLSGKHGEIWRVDPSGAVVHADVPELDPGDPPRHLLARGDTLLGWGYETYVLDPALRREPDVLVEDSLFFLPSAHPDRVWVATEDTDPAVPGFIATVREVTVAGEVTVEDVRPPNGAWPEGAVAAGLVLASDGERFVWDPLTREVVFTFPEAGDFGTTHGNLAVWHDRDSPALHVTDVVSGEEVVVSPPEGSRAFRAWDGAFSPDGATLALPIRAKGPGKRVQLGLVDVATGSVTIVPGTLTDELFNFVAWSATGSHVFFTGAEDENRMVFVYEVGAATAAPVPAAVGDFYDAAAI